MRFEARDDPPLVRTDPGLAERILANVVSNAVRFTVPGDGEVLVTASADPRSVELRAVDHGPPDISGLEVIQGLRPWNRVPIVVLSARRHGEDKVEALDAGADDYVTKPFGMDELLARLRAAVRRAAPADGGEARVVAGDLVVDLARRQVTRSGQAVRLSPTEWAMLEVLVRNRGKLVGRSDLLREVWGPAYGSETHYLRVYAAQLRRKLEADPANPVHILTQPGMGYRFEV